MSSKYILEDSESSKESIATNNSDDNTYYTPKYFMTTTVCNVVMVSNDPLLTSLKFIDQIIFQNDTTQPQYLRIENCPNIRFDRTPNLNLEQLIIYKCDLKKLRNVQRLNVQVMDFSYNLICDISGFGFFPEKSRAVFQLIVLVLSYNEIVDISVFRRNKENGKLTLQYLQELELDNNKIINIDTLKPYLKHQHNLKTIYLHNNYIQDASSLKQYVIQNKIYVNLNNQKQLNNQQQKYQNMYLTIKYTRKIRKIMFLQFKKISVSNFKMQIYKQLEVSIHNFSQLNDKIVVIFDSLNQQDRTYEQ
ncbi:Leucine-rich_repeat domain superfamily [Hexamita inflata]|uniref:Leucine-rich repeat domain superfamily n=1 Tax=Hexamita inflata TaxID=28002 RepID=A0AA86NAB3_9EUKA|nr:Leucine-rich repeat domain superfamily [Hexamita inflata]